MPIATAIVYVLVENTAGQPIQNPIFTPNYSFVSIEFEGRLIGNPPTPVFPGSPTWMMGVRQGATITVTAEGFDPVFVDTFSEGNPFLGTNREMPLRALFCGVG
jgi:hypothetical protein